MNKILLLAISILTINVSLAQFSIKSGDKDVLNSREITTDSIKMNVSSSLKTSSSATKSRSAVFKLFAKREDVKVTLNLTLEKGETPSYISIERKTSEEISEYHSIKEFTSSELKAITEDGKYLFDDNFPESRKVNSFYRVVYKYDDGIYKMTSGVLLAGQTKMNDGAYGDHVQDTSLFIDERNLANPTGLDLSVVKEDGKVLLTIGKINDFVTIEHNIYIERRTNLSSTNFRSIKELSNEDVQELIDNKTVTLQDKYPAPIREKSFYRIVVKEKESGVLVKELDAVQLF